MKNYLLICMLIFGIAVLASCGSSSSAVKEDEQSSVASIYNPSKYSLHPDYMVFHENDQQSIMYIRAYPAELRFSQANTIAEYVALLSVHYQLMELDENDAGFELVDSATVVYKVGKNKEDQQAFFASLRIQAKSGKRYMLKVESEDLQRGSKGMKFVYVDKTTRESAQNFKVISANSGYPKFLRFFLSRERFMVQHRDPFRDTVAIDYFVRHNELPRPPVTATTDFTLTYLPDTTLYVPLSDTQVYNLTNEGRYLIRVDPKKEEGMTLYNFGGSFPDVKTPDELMEPLFYLTTLTEYRDLREDPNRKLAVDNFWLGIEDNMERSRELIRIYYNRVVYSNYYFTTNKEGWKTDPGMIYVLMGPPSRIRMDGEGESWYYFHRRQSKMVEFRFNRSHDVFSNSNLDWDKSIDSKLYWNEAIASWRSGKVYTMSN